MSIIVSYFNHVYDTIPKDYELADWIKMTINPPENIEQEVEKYRETLDKKLKEKLPCVTISASFNKVRNLENIKKKNNYICLDVDRFAKSKKNKSNVCINMLLVKEMFMQHPSTFYAGFSVSGEDNGVYAIIKIHEEERFAEYFDFFKEKFSHIGINIDNACKDFTRLRFFSVDKEGYYNPNAKAYVLPEKPVEQPKIEEKPVYQHKPREHYVAIYENSEKAKKICSLVQKQAIDITSSYEDWFKIGAALYSEFGEDGRQYFQILSSYHKDYNPKACDEKYNQCKKVNNIRFGTLLTIAASYGIRYMER